jgi:hypothetical protein
MFLRTIRLSLLIAGGIFTAAISMGSQNAIREKGHLTVSVKDAAGVVIPMVFVYIRPDAATRPNSVPPGVTGRTNVSGKFEIDMEQGFYDVCVMSDSFQPDCKKE